MLKESETVGPVLLEIEEMPESDLKNIYLSEEVKYSKIFL